MSARAARRNMAERAGESWRPPIFSPESRGPLAAARRLLDLQAGSLWRDLSVELGAARGTVLDVGCGAQPYRSLLPPETHYIGIDYADAKRHFGYEMPDTLYYEGDRWPIEDGTADVVLSTETLEHVPEPRDFLAEAFRCLRPGGRLILTVPFAARWHYIPHDYWRYTPSGLARLLEGAGFRRVAVYARGNRWTVACYKNMALLLPFLLPQEGGAAARWLRRAVGVATSPLLLLLAVGGTLSLRADGGDDCLGYTATAERP